MSPTASYASSSYSNDVQSEKLSARTSKSSLISCWPFALRHAPNTLTGSLRDQSARRGAGWPSCSARSASYSAVLTQVRNSSRWPCADHDRNLSRGRLRGSSVLLRGRSDTAVALPPTVATDE